jgi:hypothetical protein
MVHSSRHCQVLAQGTRRGVTSRENFRMKTMGRPSIYSDELADKICDEVMEGKSLVTICREPGMPHRLTVLRWLTDEKHQYFCDSYARAKEIQADKFAEEIIDIADNVELGETVTEKPTGTERKFGDMTEHRRLKIDARKWYAAKLSAKYREKAGVDVTNSDGSLTDDTTRAARLAALVDTAKARKEASADAPE